ncbi:MAG: asparaginase [Burkholderiaceae bacterium]
MQSTARDRTVVLGTGGTIAGTAADPADNVGYDAAQIGVAQLVEAVPALAGLAIESEQVAQLDSKDMDFATWQRLVHRVAHHLARAEVSGIVITHGTDTLEETAYFLQRVLAPGKPVVLTAAMRPATALLADGPQNLLDAVRVARSAGARGVVAVLAGKVFSAFDVRKVHTYRLDAFGAGEAGPIGFVEEGRLRMLRPWPEGAALGLARIDVEAAAWPRVEIIVNHVGAGPAVVNALLTHGVDAIVVAGTGNGSMAQALEAALREAERAGVRVVRCSRCADGPVIGGPDEGFAAAGASTAVQARVELLLEVLRSR